MERWIAGWGACSEDSDIRKTAADQTREAPEGLGRGGVVAGVVAWSEG